MKSSYKKLGQYIRIVDERNKDLQDLPLMGLSVKKIFFPTIANLVGTDMSTYKIVYKNQFTYIADTSRRGDKIAIALNENFDKMLVSQAYTPFEIIDKNELLPEYLMMWFRRPEFDRYARFKSHGSAREIFGWDEMCDTELPIPSIEKQKEIVKEYHILVDRIAVNNQFITKLEEITQAIYKQWFVDFEFPDENGKPYKSNVGEMAWCEELEMEIPAGWEFGEFKNVCDKIFSGGTPNTNIKEYWNGDVFWLSSGETRNSVIIDTERTISKIGVKNSSTKKAIEGDSIIASAGQGKTRGQTSLCKIETYINQSVICIRPIANHYKIWNFLNLYSRYQELRNDSDAHSIRGSLLGKDIGSLKTILPKDEIVIRFDKVTNPFFDKIYLCRKINLNLNDAQSVLHSKMTKVETQKEIV